MKLAVGFLNETSAIENRVAATPETISKLKQSDIQILIETQAGKHAFISDEAFKKAGAVIKKDAQSVFDESNVIIKMNPPLENEISNFTNQTVLIAPLFLFKNPGLLKKLAEKKLTVFALDHIPRIARAQSMDILSSMSNLSGYKAVILASDHLSKILPMMMTASGTLRPAKVMVIGAGVAGLQTIATAKRLGAVVTALDTRPVTEEQVKSLGAEFVSLAVKHSEAEDKKGYAKIQSNEFYEKEQNIIQNHLHDVDMLVSTALIPGQAAPLLITDTMVRNMKPGSVIVDLAAEQGGNCELSEPHKIIIKHHVTIIGYANLASLMPVSASQMLAKNILAFLNHIIPFLKNELDEEDEIIQHCLKIKNGEVTHPETIGA